MLTARPMHEADLGACVGIVNHIIELGGSTAHEDLFTTESFAAHYFHEPEIANVVCLDQRIVGFQGLFRGDGGTYYIGSFTDRRDPVQGAGRVMTNRSIADCRAAGGTEIIAKITSDNTGGLSFYAAMGFEDIGREMAQMTRRDGTVVDRIIKRLVL